ncbi:alpha/beta fold hydrolase [Caldimonas tepidiphila]|uniref:alpha/beta fold hydrolase n=1 Tax=Caldimonas tepidiphila TaxID=2315841 RepID=UPI001474DEEB|nr:alpha/beta fold hydrolase [Caldimonas tepidiphila]
MELSIRNFGAPGRAMVGVMQHARAGAARRSAFLLCRPYGQEAIRTSPMYRAISDRLAREGCDVLRFDYHGSGDSAGDESAQSLSLWVEDTMAAHELLLAEDPQRAVHWFGLGLGANIALRAAARARRVPRHLVLWDPVLDGPRYMQALCDSHRTELSRELGLEWHQLVRRGREREPALPGTVLGFPFGEKLCEELRHLRELPLAAAARRGVRLSCAVPEDDRPRLEGALDASRLTLHSLETRTNWMSTEAMGTAIVPQEVMRSLLSTLE